MPRPKAPPYLAFELDALPRSDLAARSAGLDDGLAARALLSVWEYAWREQVEWIRPEVLLGCCRGNVRLAEALAAVGFGFLEPVPAGWFSEPCTPDPIPVAGHRIRGARRYLRIGSPQSKGGHAAKTNLIPGARYRRPAETAESEGAPEQPKLSAASRLPLGCLSAEVSADSRHQRAATIDDRESQQQHLAGAAAPAGEPLASGPVQTPAPPAKDAQEPAQAVLVPVPERPAKRTKPAKAEAAPTSPRFRALSDRLVEGYRRATGKMYVFQGPKDGAAVGRLCSLVTEALTVEDIGRLFEAALVARFGPATGIADFASRPNDPRWGAPSARAEDQHHNPNPGVYHG